MELHEATCQICQSGKSFGKKRTYQLIKWQEMGKEKSRNSEEELAWGKDAVS